MSFRRGMSIDESEYPLKRSIWVRLEGTGDEDEVTPAIGWLVIPFRSHVRGFFLDRYDSRVRKLETIFQGYVWERPGTLRRMSAMGGLLSV